MPIDAKIDTYGPFNLYLVRSACLYLVRGANETEVIVVIYILRSGWINGCGLDITRSRQSGAARQYPLLERELDP